MKIGFIKVYKTRLLHDSHFIISYNVTVDLANGQVLLGKQVSKEDIMKDEVDRHHDMIYLHRWVLDKIFQLDVTRNTTRTIDFHFIIRYFLKKLLTA